MNYPTFPTRFRPFSGILDQFFSNIDQIQGSDEHFGLAPRVNITENGDGFKLEMQAPGYDKEDLKLNLENDVLTISAEKEHEELKENERYTRREFSQSSFSRSFRLPQTVDAEKISAEHVNGVLKVSIPKKVEVKPATKQINIG
ncbi:MAG: Hsp20/alpha crystallin family protein [Flavobacteriales bacterium]|nr:Hsp20/alpha crystallin family protein [Flavobacteriales bacterium]MEB2341596.1 Hsp20/alpha crystallin family protein [Flavobacteriia bacterium]